MEDFTALYYQKPYVKEFDATVIACTKTDRGYEIELSDTAFYPEGGGQPSDKGVLTAKTQPEKAIQVTDTQLIGEHIIHIADTGIPVGTPIHGILDWENRCDNMQGHSGEHILTGIIYQTYGFNNIGFHMGENYITADFNGQLTEDQVLAVEQRANEIIRANIPIEESFPTEEERKTMQYRSKKELSGTVRIITIPGLDACACCGTHVSATGEVGFLKIINATNRKKGIRLELLCGRKALLAYEQEMAQARAISRCLSAKPSEIQAAVEKLNAEKSKLQQLLHEMTRKYLEQKAASSTEEGALQICFEKNLGIEELRYFCTQLLQTGKVKTCAVLSEAETSAAEASAYNYVIITDALDLKQYVKTLNQQLNGRGGTSTAIQGTYFASPAIIREKLEHLLQSTTPTLEASGY